MMEYTNKYWNMIIPLVKKELSKKYGKAYTKDLLEKSNREYRNMLERADDIGKENPMASNFYEGLIFFALYKAAEGKIRIEDLKAIANKIFSIPLLKIVGLFINLNKKSGIKKYSNMIKKDAQWIEEHPQYKDVSWDFNFDESKNKEGFYYHFTRCPLNNFARKEGFLDVLQVMCDVDYKTANLFHANLNREQTLAQGGDKCDYWFVGDKIK